MEEKLQGWEQLMRDKCLKNELMDIKAINMPDLSTNQSKSDIYIYAGFIKPGYH